MKRPNKYSKPLGGIRTESYHPSDYTNNQYADDLNKYIDYLESELQEKVEEGSNKSEPTDTINFNGKKGF